MTQKVDFKEIINRDAWSTIRGFVYQVDYTILRWLELKEDELLELERGEDIDHLQYDLENNQIRDLQQVKYREANITLNTDLTLELLKNFYDHKVNNPKKKIRFCFITNAVYGHERPSIFINGDKGIDRWISLYQPQTEVLDSETVTTLKKHLQNRIREQILPDTNLSDTQLRVNERWQAFHDHLDDGENLNSFLIDFRWATNKEDQFSIVENLFRKIQDKFAVADPRPIYERLFVFVFKLLSAKGLKQLDIGSLKQLDLYTATDPQDSQLYSVLKNVLENVDERLQNLEQRTNEHTLALDKVFRELDVLKSDTTFSYRLQHISTSAPVAIQNGSFRTEKVRIINEFLRLLPWVAFQGINGSGKTQLASLVSRSYQDAFWLDLREYHADLKLSALALEVFLATISEIPLQPNKKGWMGQVIASLPRGCLLVINDVPRLDDSVPGLNELFCFLVNTLDQNRIKLITTSNFSFPDSVIQKCPEDCVLVFDDLDFDDQEILEYLVNQGAPEDFLRMIAFIAVRAQRNPRLTTAMINHLKNINWGADSDQLLETVMNTEFASGVLEDAQQSIIRYISDQSSKELLYRLSLISWPFGINQVQAVSQVEAEISHPAEKMQSFLHLWIQLKEKGQHEISPIVQNIGLNNLDQQSIQNVYLAIAQSILDEKVLNQFSANRALMAFISGKDFEGAGMVLLKMYEATQTPEQGKILFASGLLYYWISTDFPVAMSIGMKIMIRREQLRLYTLIGRDVSNLLQHTKTIFQDRKATLVELAIARMMLITTYFEHLPVSDYVDYLAFVLENLENLEEIRPLFSEAGMLSNLIWLPAMRLTSLEQLEAWIEMADLAASRGVDVFESGIKIMVIGILCSAIVKREHPGVEDEEGLAMLNKLQEFLSNAEREDLAVYPARSLVELQSKWYNDPKGAIERAKHYLNEYTAEQARFILSAQLGRLYRDLSDREEEVSWFRMALSYDPEDSFEQIDILESGAVAVSGLDTQESVKYCRKAVDLAQGIPTYGKTDYILLLDELSVAHWLNGDAEQTFITLEDIVSRLFEIKKDHFGTVWIRLFSLTAHFGAYCSSMISDGVPPKTGGKDFFEPYQGMFNNTFNDFTSRYDDNHDSFIFVQLAYFAAALGKMETAYKWSLKAFDAARSSGSQEVFKTVSSVSAHFAILSFKPTEAFEAYLYNGAVISHLKGSPQERRGLLKNLDSANFFTQKPSSQWADAEDTATTLAVLPLFMMLLSAIKENRKDKNQMKASYLKMIAIYQATASDELLFDLLNEISTKILDNKISVETLGERANNFGRQERNSLQILCLLGIIHLTRNQSQRLVQMVNIVPKAQKILSAAKHTSQFTLVPFVQIHAIDIIESEFVGSRNELALLKEKIANVNAADSNCTREIINLVRQVVDVKVPDDRQQWLSGEDI